MKGSGAGAAHLLAYGAQQLYGAGARRQYPIAGAVIPVAGEREGARVINGAVASDAHITDHRELGPCLNRKYRALVAEPLAYGWQRSQQNSAEE
jgi:hypothetical protein